MCSSTFILMVIQISLSFDRPLIFYIIYNDSKLTIFDGLSNDNEITWNLNDHQYKDKEHIYKLFPF
jgi:hypothetical protein